MALPALDPDSVVAACPVGTMVETHAGPEGLATASYDTDRVYRYRVSRVWDQQAPRVVFAMLNPSTTTAFVLDNTVRRCVRFARAWSAGALEVVNIFAFRSTDPRALYTHPDPVGPGNDTALLVAATAAAGSGGLVVAGWGVRGALHDRCTALRHLLADADVMVHALRVTKYGHRPPAARAEDRYPATLGLTPPLELTRFGGHLHVGHSARGSWS